MNAHPVGTDDEIAEFPSSRPHHEHDLVSAMNIIVATGSSTRVSEDARGGVPGRPARKP